MKSLSAGIILSFLSFSTIACPVHQDLYDVNENYKLSIMPTSTYNQARVSKNMHSWEFGKSKSMKDYPLTEFSIREDVKLKKGEELRINFGKIRFWDDGSHYERATDGKLTLNGKKVPVILMMRDKSSEKPTVQNLIDVLGDDFKVICKLKELPNKEKKSKDKKAASQQ